jgi:hypothetical protein
VCQYKLLPDAVWAKLPTCHDTIHTQTSSVTTELSISWLGHMHLQQATGVEAFSKANSPSPDWILYVALVMFCAHAMNLIFNPV